MFEPKRVDEVLRVSGECSRWREPATSVCMGQDKVHDHMSTGAEYITGADSSCLMHMEGIIRREKIADKDNTRGGDIKSRVINFMN